MAKNSVSELVAQGMLEVLNSESHAKLFKKAYVQKEAAVPAAAPAPAAKPAAPAAAPGAAAKASMPMKADDANDVKGGKCAKCKRDEDNCYCGDSMMADDNDARKAKKCEKCDCMPCKCSDSNDVTTSVDHDSAWVKDKESRAFNVAMESLLTASAALDYAGLVKGSELTLKLAALVAEAKKGKVNLKADKKSDKKSNKNSDKKMDKSDARAKLTEKEEKEAKEHLKKLRELGSAKKPASKSSKK